MKVYPTRRSAAVPQRIYDATKHYASTAALVEGGNGVTGAVNGIPFPIPSVGVECIWNHMLRYRAEAAARDIGQAAPTRGGDYTLVQFRDEFYMVYSMPDMSEEKLNNRILFFKQEVMAPARLAGGILLVQETLDQVKENRNAWLYNPGQRRVRRAPNVAYDNPGTAADSMRTSDQLDMFNGAPDRYDWKLVGKKEIYVPYNAYKLQDPSVKNKDILTPLHINQELPALRAAPGVGGGLDPQGGRAPHLQTAHVLPRRGQLADSWRSTPTTNATSCGGCPKATPCSTTTCRACGPRSRSTPTCRRADIWRSV